jgi:TonB dependent receptor/TonB-dependent Receptor Plug Domain
VTDENGGFSVPLSRGFHTIEIKFLSFLPERPFINVVSDTTITVIMTEIVNQLEQAIITADRTTENIRKPVLGVLQINNKVLKKIPAAFGETDLLRGLQMLPGVSTVGEASNGINVRGGSTDQNLLLLDDTPIFNPTHMFGLFSVFPPDAVNRAELYKGNVPSRFGGRASAVLDVAIENPALDSLRFDGGISLISTRATVNTPIIKGKMGVLASARGSFMDFLLPIISKKNFEDTQAKFGETCVKLSYIPNDKNTFFLTSYYSKDFFQTGLLGTIGNINSKITQNDYSTLNFALKHFHTFKENLSMSTSAIYVDYKPKLILPEAGVDNKVVFQSSVGFRQLKSNLDYYKSGHQMKLGFTASYYSINPGELVPNNSPSVNALMLPKENSLETGLFIEDNFDISSRISASAGLRYSYFMNFGPSDVRLYQPNLPLSDLTVMNIKTYNSGEIAKTYGGFEPRLGLRYTLNKSSSLKLAYNMMRQYIQIITNTTTPLPTSRWKTSDEHIKPVVSQALSIGWFKNFSENRYETTLEAYYRATDNVLDYKQGANLLLQPYVETELLRGINKSYGVEFMVAKKKGERTGWLSYTFSRSLNQVDDGPEFSQRINDGKWFPANYDRPHTLNAFYNYNFSKFHNFSFTFTYSTGRPFTSPKGVFAYQGSTYPFFEERNNNRIPAYNRLDFSWNILTTIKEGKRWKNYWSVSIYNIYGKGNPYSIFYKERKSYTLKIFAVPIFSLAYNLRFE